MRQYGNFSSLIFAAKHHLKEYGQIIDTGHWQGVPTGGRPDLQTVEVMNFDGVVKVPDTIEELQAQIQPNLPWADEHFTERVSREPSNPGESYKNWPWWRGQYDATAATPQQGQQAQYVETPDQLAVMGEVHPYEHKFTHTYQERFWPKGAGERPRWGADPIPGIRYDYGDLDDVVGLLLREPLTRQAYLPIFFPEDTGAVHGGRIPCTLGYHFMLRNGQLHMWYEIRSCDFVRHFRDDLYLACRLLLWVIDELRRRDRGEDEWDPDMDWDDIAPGYLTFLAHSLHYHRGDEHLVRG